MRSRGYRKRSQPGPHGTRPAAAMLTAFVRILAPLALIAIVAVWLLSGRGGKTGSVRVTTSVPGADIFIGGSMTGYQSDTTLIDVPVGRRIITVRKEGYVSEPEVIVADVERNQTASISFKLKNEKSLAKVDSIPPLRRVRQDILSTGEPIRSVPPASYRPQSKLLDFSIKSPEFGAEATSRLGASMTTTVVPSDGAGSASVSSSPEANASVAQVTVSSFPDGAQIFVNGTLTTRVTPYTFRGLQPGVYVFRVGRPGYKAVPDSISVSLSEGDETELVAFDLAQKPELPKPTLTVQTTPAAGSIRIDGRAAGVGKVAQEISFGSHTVAYGNVPGYRSPSDTTVSVTEDTPNPEIVGSYERIVGNCFLALAPNEEQRQRFDGSKLRVYVDNELILDNPKDPFDATLLGRIPSGKRLVRVEYGDLANDIHVNLQEGEVSEVTFRVESFFSKRKLRLREQESIPLEKWEQKTRRLTVLNAS